MARNPAAGLAKPRRARSRRRALDDDELGQLDDAVCSTSRDPGLDILLVRFHLESGARRQGALGLRLRDLGAHRSTVWLREKGDSDREQPISPSLTRLLTDHATTRGAISPDDAVLRTRDGRPISARRNDTIFGRARVALGCAERTPVSAHGGAHPGRGDGPHSRRGRGGADRRTSPSGVPVSRLPSSSLRAAVLSGRQRRQTPSSPRAGRRSRPAFVARHLVAS
ncbi:MAG: tyrosine-type recombinase/integrase [Acidimicrobiales bacterium]